MRVFDRVLAIATLACVSCGRDNASQTNPAATPSLPESVALTTSIMKGDADLASPHGRKAFHLRSLVDHAVAVNPAWKPYIPMHDWHEYYTYVRKRDEWFETFITQLCDAARSAPVQCVVIEVVDVGIPYATEGDTLVICSPHSELPIHLPRSEWLIVESQRLLESQAVIRDLVTAGDMVDDPFFVFDSARLITVGYFDGSTLTMTAIRGYFDFIDERNETAGKHLDRLEKFTKFLEDLRGAGSTYDMPSDRLMDAFYGGAK